MSTLPFYERRERKQQFFVTGALASLPTAAGLYLGLWLAQPSPLVAMAAWAPAAAVGLALASRLGKRSWQLALVMGIALGGAGGILFYAVAAPAPRLAATPPAERNVQLQALQLQRELAIYAQRPRRSTDEPAYPTNRGLAAYLAGLKGKQDLPAVAARVGKPLRGAADLAAGMAPPAIGVQTDLKPGSLVYDHDDASDTYVLYAIGQHGELVGQARSVH